MDDPSWLEIRHFVTFLDLQLESCEDSIYTNAGDVLSGFKEFVVKFMIEMSTVSSTTGVMLIITYRNLLFFR